MAEPPLHLIIGNYNTSSWSLRAWLALRCARLAFIETRIPLRTALTPGRIAEVSPSGKLPVLLAEGVPIWDSLAIAEFVAELEPGIWPLDPIARAEARAISAEVHSGFADLRRLMPMDVVGRFSPPGRLPRGLAADIDRIKAICGHCRARFAPHGPFLFGAFSIADCMMAPIASRLVTHGVPLDGAVEDYVDSVMSWPDMVTWCDAAAAEQAERAAQGTLGVVRITRQGRVLGREPAARATMPAPASASGAPAVAATTIAPALVEPQSAGHEVQPAADDAGRAVEQAMLATAMSASAATAPTDTQTRPAVGSSAGAPAAGDEGDSAPATAPAAPEVSPAVAAPGAAPIAAALPADTAARLEQPTPRRRLFEPAPSPEAAPPAAGAAAETHGEQAAADRPAPVAVGDGELPAPPRLGWIRRPVPLEQRGMSQAPAADGPSPAPPHQVPEPPRPSSPAVKPIGGGILRRR